MPTMEEGACHLSSLAGDGKVCNGQWESGLGCRAPGITVVRVQVRLLLVTYVLSCLRYVRTGTCGYLLELTLQKARGMNKVNAPLPYSHSPTLGLLFDVYMTQNLLSSSKVWFSHQRLTVLGQLIKQLTNGLTLNHP